MTMGRESWGRWALLAVVGAMGMGCGGKGGEGGGEVPVKGVASVPTTPESGDTLVVAYQQDADFFIPIVSQNAYTSALAELIFPQLFDGVFDNGALVYRPQLVEKWSWDPTHTELTLQFRKDAQWTDGAPVTVDDYLFTMELIADPDVNSPRQSYLENMVKPQPFTKVDDHTVTIKFLHPYDEQTMMAEAGGVGVLPKHILQPLLATKDQRTAIRGLDFGQKPVGSGPFRLAKWEKGQTMVLEANPKVAETGKPHLKRVIFKIIPEYTTRLVELENGSADLLMAVQPEDYARLKAPGTGHPELNFYRRGYRLQDYIAWNLRNPLFSDLKVRQALAHGIDKEQLIQTLLSAGGETFGRPATSTITPELKRAYNADIQPVAHNVEKAKSLLAEAGWRDSDGDGWVDKGGKPFKFRLDTNTGNPRRAKAVVLIQEQLKKIGVQVEINSLEANTFGENMRNRKFEAILAGWSAGLFVSPDDMWGCEKPDQPRVFNYPGYCDPETDALIEKGLKEPDAEKSAVIWKEFQKRVHDAQPYAFLYWMDEVVAVHKRFKNVQINILSGLFHLNEWWVPKAEQKYPD